MKEYKPSDDFVSRVMENVHAYEQSRKVDIPVMEKLISSRILRYAMSASGLLLGIWNLMRLYASVFAPVVCK